MWVGPALGDEVSVPAQQGRRLDEEVPEMLAGEQSCESRHRRPVRRVQRRSVDLAPQYRHLVAQHDDLDGEIGVTTEDESDELEDAAERLVEEREGHGRMLAAPESRRQSAGRRPWMAFSAPTSAVLPRADRRGRASRGIILVLHLSRVEIHESARRHGVVDEDIQHALAHAVIWVELGDDPWRYLLAGPDRAGNMLELVILDLGGDELVIHAMGLRRSTAQELFGDE